MEIGAMPASKDYNSLNLQNWVCRSQVIQIHNVVPSTTCAFYLRGTWNPIIFVDAAQLTSFLVLLEKSSIFSYHQLADIAVYDRPGRKDRFSLTYHLLSHHYNNRLTIQINVSDNQLPDSVVKLFSNAGWIEREIYDLFGIAFGGNQDLRKLLTDYGYDVAPLRKTTPLSGAKEVRYSENKKRVLYQLSYLDQTTRSIFYEQPWD